ncbi:MAG: 2-(1,2-epoxy-1,2-dihydrophenyl)acetyl-CoA isomerase [Planctomycetota bacterium]|nr:MAG: 2-(1,2-epoxy-1,2-dihydrophenyl)acetyl-CoA isomerase [Planctomycetota bacterium]
MATKNASYETLLVTVQDGVRTIAFNRPDEMNVVDERVTSELQAELRAIGKDKATRCVVLTGVGKAFCAGQDLKSATSREGPFDFTDALRRRYNPVVLGFRSLELPVIAAINGVAAGAGWSLALACDLRIASASAKFVGAFSRIGLVPDSGMTWILTQLVGTAKALELAWLGEPLTADAALQLGLVNRVVPAEELEGAARQWAVQLAKGPTKGLGLTKRAVYTGLGRDLESQLEYEALLQGVAGRTTDYAEGVKAFIEKRAPEFKGE